jgi:hypothetical protein
MNEESLIDADWFGFTTSQSLRDTTMSAEKNFPGIYRIRPVSIMEGEYSQTSFVFNTITEFGA